MAERPDNSARGSEPARGGDRDRAAAAGHAASASPASAALPRAPFPAATWLGVELPTVAENLALDEALLELAHEGLAASACVRTWMAAEPTVVLGSSGRLAAEVDLEACRRHGVRVLRRPSGGGTVLLGPGCLMWSVITPHPEGPPPIESIHAGLLTPLAATITAHLQRLAAGSGAGDTAAADDAVAAAWAGAVVARRGTSDLAVEPPVRDESVGRRRGDAAEAAREPTDASAERLPAKKVAGTALRVRRHGVLYHGTLLDSFDLGLVSQVLAHPPREPGYRGGRSHGEFLTNLGLGRQTLERLVRTAFGAAGMQHDWPCDRVARLVRDRYADADWTTRL